MKQIVFIFTLLINLCATASDFVVDGIHYNILNDSEVEVTYEKNQNGNNASTYVGNIIVPNKVSYRNIDFQVTQIGQYAFAGCKMESVQLPETIKILCTSAFTGCKVKSLYLPNSISDIGDYCCADMSNVEELHLPENPSVTALPFHSFRGMNSLSSLDIPSNITSLGSCAFTSAKSLTSLKFHNKLSRFGASCFSDCSSLEEIEFTASFVSINYYAFRNCQKLRTIKFASSNADLNGFPDCDALENIIVYDETANPISESAFSEALYLFGTLYVPSSSIDEYKNATGWSKFRNIKPISEFSSIAETFIDEPSEPRYYDLKGTRVTNPNNGVYIEVLPNNRTRLILK